MQKRDTLAKLMLSPSKAMFISIAISLTCYIILSTLSGFRIDNFGLSMSIIIPALVSYPMSYLVIRYYKKIEVQKDELKRLNETNNRLISIIAHDIRSPISGVYGVLDLIKIDALSKDELAFYINDLSETVDNLLNFLDEVLQWSKAQVDNKKIKPELLNPKKTWAQILALYQHNVDRKNINLITDNLEQPLFVDQGSYSFVIRNILQNAIKFTPQKGTIKINMVKKKDRAITIIEDSGVGISKDNLNKILHTDEWISTPGTENEKGTGFGLKAASKYIELLNGSLEIESIPKNGTKVIIDLPGSLPKSPSSS